MRVCLHNMNRCVTTFWCWHTISIRYCNNFTIPICGSDRCCWMIWLCIGRIYLVTWRNCDKISLKRELSCHVDQTFFVPNGNAFGNFSRFCLRFICILLNHVDELYCSLIYFLHRMIICSNLWYFSHQICILNRKIKYFLDNLITSSAVFKWIHRSPK